MIITCPNCQTQYRIDPQAAAKPVATVKCPSCQHRFEISLDEAGGRESSAPGAVAPDAGERPKLLVVDDARFFREMIRDLLKDLPVEIVTAADGEEAWQMIVAQRPQLVILDLNIPGRSGKEILHALRGNPDFDQTRVIVMSGVARGEATAAEMRRSGADDFFGKSFKPSDLENRVRQLLGL